MHQYQTCMYEIGFLTTFTGFCNENNNFQWFKAIFSFLKIQTVFNTPRQFSTPFGKCPPNVFFLQIVDAIDIFYLQIPQWLSSMLFWATFTPLMKNNTYWLVWCIFIKNPVKMLAFLSKFALKNWKLVIFTK